MTRRDATSRQHDDDDDDDDDASVVRFTLIDDGVPSRDSAAKSLTLRRPPTHAGRTNENSKTDSQK